MELIVVVVVAAIIWGIYSLREQRRQIEQMNRALKVVPGVWFKHKLIGAGAETAIAVDDAKGLICLFSRSGDRIVRRLIPFSALVSSEVFEDGHTVSSTSRTSQLAGMAVGGVLLGGVGAVVGGLSAKTKSVGKVSRVELRLTVDDMSAPLHTVVLLGAEVSRETQLYQSSEALAREWQSRMDVVIRRAATASS